MYHPQKASIVSILIYAFQLLTGAVVLFLFGLCTIVAATDLAEYGTAFLCICLVLDGIGILFLRAGIRRVRAIQADKRRAAQEASSFNGTTITAAVSTAAKMNQKGLSSEKTGTTSQTEFGSAQDGIHITITSRNGNPSQNASSFHFFFFLNGDTSDEEELVTVECPNCGSHTNIRKGEQQECAYCGTILKGE